MRNTPRYCDRSSAGAILQVAKKHIAVRKTAVRLRNERQPNTPERNYCTQHKEFQLRSEPRRLTSVQWQMRLHDAKRNSERVGHGNHRICKRAATTEKAFCRTRKIKQQAASASLDNSIWPRQQAAKARSRHHTKKNEENPLAIPIHIATRRTRAQTFSSQDSL